MGIRRRSSTDTNVNTMLKFIAVFVSIIFIVMIFGIGYVVMNSDKWPNPDTLVNQIVERLQSSQQINTTPTKSTIAIDIDTKPKFEFVSSTEYTMGDGNGSTIVKLVDWKGEKINTTCWELIQYPNKTIYVDWTIMTQDWTYGNYYMNFVVPTTLGIYDQEARCLVGNKNISLGKGFHVGNITNMVANDVNELKQDIMTMVT